MRPIVTDRVAWSVVCQLVGLHVSLSSHDLCKNSWTDQDAVCLVDSNNDILDGVHMPPGEGAFLGEKVGSL